MRTSANTSSSVAVSERSRSSSRKLTFIHCTTPPGVRCSCASSRKPRVYRWRGAHHPGVRRLRDDGVVAACGQRERAPRVVRNEIDARIEQRVAPAQRARGAVRLDHDRLELDHIEMSSTDGGTPSTTTPPP